MQDEKSIRMEMRLAAIEHMLANMYRMFYLGAGVPVGAACQSLDNFVTRAAGERFSGIDAALSDFASAEYEAALRRLIDAIKESVAGVNRLG